MCTTNKQLQFFAEKGTEYKMKRKALLVILTITVIGFMLGGCGSDAKENAEGLSVEANEVGEFVIGGDVQTDSTLTALLTNETGKEITGFAVKESSETEYPDNMIPEGKNFGAGQACTLCYTPEHAVVSASAQGNAVEPQYDAMITFADQTSMEWLGIPFGDMQEGKLCLAEDVLYVTYISAATNEEINTLEAAKQAKLLKEASAENLQSSSAAANPSDVKSTKNNVAPASANTKTNTSSGSAENSGSPAGVETSGEAAMDAIPSGGETASGSDSGCIGDEGLTY